MSHDDTTTATAATTEAPWTEGRIVALLRARYEAPAWVFLEQVRCGTGHQRNERYADAVAMGMYPSRGLEVHGVEVKVARSDWLRELKDPAKEGAFHERCDRWWVAAPRGVVEVAEVPAGWGLLVPARRDGAWGLRAAREAPLRDKVEAHPSLPRAFVASLLRAAVARPLPGEEEVRARLATERERGQAEGRALESADGRKALHTVTYDRDRLAAVIARFERVSGVKLDDYPWVNLEGGADRVGGVVKALVAGNAEDRLRDLRNVAHAAREVVRRVEQALAPLGEVP